MAKTTTTTAPKPTPTKTPTATAPVAAKPAAAPAKAPVAAKPAGSTCCSGTTSVKPSYEAVSQRAYEIWVRKGRPTGQDIENWKQAEAELTRGTLVNAA